jgi:alpha-ketoglutarate-dependent taurine dioxygenase
MQSFKIHPVTPTIGAEISRLDLATGLDEDVIRALREALLEHAVLFFRDQKLSPEQHVALARRFGEPHLAAVTTRHGGPPAFAAPRPHASTGREPRPTQTEKTRGGGSLERNENRSSLYPACDRGG